MSVHQVTILLIVLNILCPPFTLGSSDLSCNLDCSWKEGRCDLQLEGMPKWTLEGLEKRVAPVIHGLEESHHLHKSDFFTSQLIEPNGKTGRAYLTFHRAKRTIEGRLKLEDSSYTFSVTGLKGRKGKHLYDGTANKVSDFGSRPHRDKYAEPLERPEPWISFSMQKSRSGNKHIDGNICGLYIAVHNSVIQDIGKSEAYYMVQMLIIELSELYEQSFLPNGKRIDFELAFLELATDQVCATNPSCVLCGESGKKQLIADQVLREFDSFSPSTKVCASILLTKQTFVDDKIGLAFKNGVCKGSGNSALVSISQNKGTLHTMAHEMGHIFGIPHSNIHDDYLMNLEAPLNYNVRKVWTFDEKSVEILEDNLQQLANDGQFCFKDSQEYSKDQGGMGGGQKSRCENVIRWIPGSSSSCNLEIFSKIMFTMIFCLITIMK